MSVNRVFNFSAGPAMLPTEVLEKASQELLSLDDSGMSVMEISHRSKKFFEILERTKQSIKDLLNVPPDYKILFFPGGASLQFALIPLNFLHHKADFIVTGYWSQKAFKEASKLGVSNLIYTSEASNFSAIPRQQELKFSEDADYVHYCSNETIHGVEFDYDLTAGDLPIVCDASSNIMSKSIDITKYSLIYAGAQKNLGPSGITLVIVHEDFLQRARKDLPTIFSYLSFANENSMPNTPNTWGIYMIGLVCEWIKQKGGIAAIEKLNQKKAQLVYDEIDNSDGFYRGRAIHQFRSRMNITFNLKTESLENKFCDEAERKGLMNLRGHRSTGGIRASIYNAFPLDGVIKLKEFMREFREMNS